MHVKAWAAAQAWDEEAAATQQSSLTPEQQWEVGRQLVASLGDPHTAERCMPALCAMAGTYPPELPCAMHEDSITHTALHCRSADDCHAHSAVDGAECTVIASNCGL